MSTDTWDMNQIAKALTEIRACETWFNERAKAAGLNCQVYLYGYGDRQKQSVGIKLTTYDRRSFLRDKSRAPTTWANAYSIPEFDKIVADTVEYLKKKGTRR